ISGQVLKGLKKPHDCPAFGKQCTPQTPLGATMVSAEGACAAYYAYGRHLELRKVHELQPVGLEGALMAETTDLRGAILRKCRESMAVKEKFFTDNAELIVECCAVLARSFGAGGRLFVMGNGGAACGAGPLSGGFMHPIIVKRPAPPPVALTTATAAPPRRRLAQ